MGDPSSQTIRCPHCGQPFRWKAEAVGKKVRCRCSQTFRVPEHPGTRPVAIGSPERGEADSTYELDDQAGEETPRPGPSKPAVKPSPGNKCPSCNRPLKPGGVLCLNCGFDLRQGQKIQTAVQSPVDTEAEDAASEPVAGSTIASQAVASTLAGQITARRERDAEMADEAARRHRFNDLHLPLILIGACIPLYPLVEFGFPLLTQGTGWKEGAIYMLYAAGRLIVQVPTIILGIFVVAKVFGSGFGGLATGLLKLLAITAVTGLAADTVKLSILVLSGGITVFFFEQMLAMLIGFCVFWALCAKLFEMEPQEIIVMFGILVIGPLFLGLFVIAPIVATFLG